MTSGAVYILCQGAIDETNKRIDNLPKAFIPQGTITFAQLPATPTADKLGFIWNVSDAFTTDNRFIEGAGKKIAAGNNVGIIKHDSNYYYDVMSQIDLSNYYTKVETENLVNAEKLLREQADASLQTAITDEINNRTSADAELNTNKLNVLPKVDDPTDTGFGWEYHIPYRFDVALDAEKADIDLHTLTLDNKVTKMKFSKQIPSASTTKAGLMSASDKVIVDSVDYKIEMEATNRADADTLIRSDLSSEVSARTNGDNALSETINQESITREQADNTLQTNIDKKQDKLVAGTNIQIATDGKTISATDTVYDDTEVKGLITAEETRAKGIEATKADLPGKCPAWLNPTGQTPYPWFMASLDVESTGKGPDAEGNLLVDVGAYNFNDKQYYKWEKSLPFAATTTKAGLMTAADKTKLNSAITEHQDISGKQDKLTAGENITIDENNVISAVGTSFDEKTIIKGADNKYQTAIGGWKENTPEQTTELFINTKGNGLPTYLGPSASPVIYEVGWDYNTRISDLITGRNASININVTILGTNFNGKVALTKSVSIPANWESDTITIGGKGYKVKIGEGWVGINQGGLTIMANDPSTDISDSTMKSLALVTGSASVVYHPIDNKFLKIDNTLSVDADNELKVNTDLIQSKLTADKNITITNNTIKADAEYISLAGESGTITDEQLSVINDNSLAYISLNNKNYHFSYVTAGRGAVIATYSAVKDNVIYYIDVNVVNKTWTSKQVSLQDKLTVGEGIDITNNVISNPLSSLVPAQATSTNKLADKAFVTDTVSTSSANFRGSWGTYTAVPTDSTKYPSDYSGSTVPVTNDYLVVQDASDYTASTLEGTWRFKYGGLWSSVGKSGWLPEYQVSAEPLTSEQLAALNSGVTSSTVSQVEINKTAINNKQDKLTAGSDITIDANNKISVDVGSIFNMIYPVGSYHFGLTAPTLGIWEKVEGDKAIWIKSDVSDGTNISQSLPIPSIESTFTGVEANTTTNGAHAHSTDVSGYHSHNRGDMNIYGLFNMYWKNINTSGALFGERCDYDNPMLSSSENGTYRLGINAANNWTGNTNTAGGHNHGTDSKGSHNHSFTPSGAVSTSVTADTIYKSGANVQPNAVVMTVWKRIS